MADNLASRAAASENAFFKAEQERVALEYLNHLLSTGRKVESLPSQVGPKAHGMLPQIAAQSLRIDAKQKATHFKKELNFEWQVGKRPAWKKIKTPPLYVGTALMGSQVSLGKSKWTAGASTNSAGVSVWDAAAGVRLASGGSGEIDALLAHTVPQTAAEKAAISTETVQLGGMKWKKLPDFTPGRALAWGSLIAMWGTAFLVMRSARALDIHGTDEARGKLEAVIQPFGAGAATALTPVKERLQQTFHSEKESPLMATLRSKYTKH